MKNYRVVTTAIMVTLIALPLFGQEKKRLSPAATATGVIDGEKITIDYSAPSKRGREIMGGLVPFGTVWRTGANEATTLKTEANLRIGGLAVPKGTYTIYTLPNAKEWTLIINKQTGQWGTKYDQTQDLGRVPMTVKSIQPTVETFVISIVPGKGKSGALKLTWENTEASVPISVE